MSEVSELRQLLRRYGALDNENRLRAFLAIYENPGISFNEIARRVGVKRELLAYHLSVLKAADLVAMNLDRRGKAISNYQPTEEGKALMEAILSEHELLKGRVKA
ncbi:MAG: helix-turn-helix domain-containing protein [Candidatus Bathyarchaeia archaeon]